ncbi:hypothetical protein [Pedobacter sp. NJ-S-72]
MHTTLKLKLHTMKINIRVHLYTSKIYTDNTHPVILMYTIDDKKIKKVITRCAKDDWNLKNCRVKSSDRNSANKNRDITSEYSKAKNMLHDLKLYSLPYSTFPL